MRILIVEDEVIFAMYLQSSLRARGQEVVGMAISSRQALSLVEKLKPDIVLMDIYIKGGRDGIETATMINTLYPQASVVFITANTDRTTRDRALATRHSGYLEKPFVPEQLDEIIANLKREKLAEAKGSEAKPAEAKPSEAKPMSTVL